MQKIAPKILTAGEIFNYAATEVQRKILGKKMPAYKPQFTKCVDHFLIHAGGAKVLDGIGKELQLDEFALEPSRMVLHDYGNVSSSTTWYTMGYLESVRGTKKGDKLLQIGVGSGQNYCRHKQPDNSCARSCLQLHCLCHRYLYLCMYCLCSASWLWVDPTAL